MVALLEDIAVVKKLRVKLTELQLPEHYFVLYYHAPSIDPCRVLTDYDFVAADIQALEKCNLAFSLHFGLGLCFFCWNLGNNMDSPKGVFVV